MGVSGYRPPDRRVRREHPTDLVEHPRPAHLSRHRPTVDHRDSGGSNGNRRRTWKTELATLAAETGLAISVCHLPPGTSKWNKIEHRLFSQITMNRRGRPLTSHETILNLIGATTTNTGLAVTATLDTGNYPTGIKINDREMQASRTPDTNSTATGITPCTPPATRPNQ